MKLMFISKLDSSSRAIRTITKYVEVGKQLGHQVAVFGEQSSDMSSIPFSLDVEQFDFAIFIIYETWDFPDLPYIAQILDRIPKQRRVIIDCYARHNETIRVEHDFNHLEKMDGHQGWEWVEGFQAVSDKILQPTLSPLRDDVQPFLFHAYDPSAVVSESDFVNNMQTKPYGLTYVGNNWQRWSQIQSFLQEIEPLKKDLGPICIAGSGWEETPEWAIELGIHGADVDPVLLERLDVETTTSIPFNDVVEFMGKGRFNPIFHRPLFNHLGLVTNRTFETFCADTIPIIMINENLIEPIYGSDAKKLAPGDNIAKCLRDMISSPELYWESVIKVRDYLSKYHTFQNRFKELVEILET